MKKKETFRAFFLSQSLAKWDKGANAQSKRKQVSGIRDHPKVYIL